MEGDKRVGDGRKRKGKFLLKTRKGVQLTLRPWWKKGSQRRKRGSCEGRSIDKTMKVGGA